MPWSLLFSVVEERCGGEGAGGSIADALKSTTAGCIAVISNANNVHTMSANLKSGTAAVMPMALLARRGTGSKQPGFRM